MNFSGLKGLRLGIVWNEPYFSEFSQGCAENLEKQGCQVELLTGLPIDGGMDALLVVGIHKFPEVPLFRHTVLLGVQTEQLPEKRSSDRRLQRNLKRFHAVRGYYRKLFEWNPTLYSTGISGDVFIPYGCLPAPVSEVEKRHDILFIGNLGGSSRRREILDKLSSRFDLYPDFSPGFGKRKSEAIRSARVCLNIHYYDQGCGFESPRIFDYLSHGGFVLSERVPATQPFVVGRDLEDFGGEKELFEKISFFLEHEECRRLVAEQGRRTACRYGFEVAGNIIALEVVKTLATGHGGKEEWISWGMARARCGYFRLRDYLSMARRGGFG